MADKKVDPKLFIPIVEGYEYADETSGAVEQDSDTDTTVIDVPEQTLMLPPPEHIEFVDQIFTKGADGRTLVSLVIEVEDVQGATEYEVRTALV